MKSIYQEQLDYLENKGLKVGDIVDVEMHYFRNINTYFKAEIVLTVENPETYKLGWTCHFTDEPIKLKLIGNCSEDWLQDGNTTPIHRIVEIKKEKIAS